MLVLTQILKSRKQQTVKLLLMQIWMVSYSCMGFFQECNTRETFTIFVVVVNVTVTVDVVVGVVNVIVVVVVVVDVVDVVDVDLNIYNGNLFRANPLFYKMSCTFAEIDDNFCKQM